MTNRPRPSGRRLSIFSLTAMLTLLAAPLPARAFSGAVHSTPAAVTSLQQHLYPNFAAHGSNLIRLQVGAFDPVSDSLPSQAGIALVNEASLPAGTAQYWLLQVDGTQFAQASNAVKNAGGKVAGFLPASTFIVRATPAQKAQIAGNAAVRWMGYYQPAWRVPVAAAGKKGLLELTGAQTYRIHVFRKDPQPAAVGQALKSMTGVRVLSDATYVVDVRATKAQVSAMAAIPAVEWIAVKPTVVLDNANARWVNDTGVRDVYAATAPGRLTGAGQTAGVADTGINYTYDLNGRAHVAFRDCDGNTLTNCKTATYTQTTPGTSTANVTATQNNATNHRKVVAFFDLANAGPNPFDESSHGSHTSGSVTGDQPPYGTWNGDDGMAPAAHLVSQNIGTTSGGLSTPDDYYQLFRQAYRPRKPASVATSSGTEGQPIDYSPSCTDPAGAAALSNCYRPLEDARTHNNSYGLIAPIIDDGQADLLDEFVWDHEDMFISVSAGNAGPVAASIGTPSVAKNNISSGASANGRQPMTSIDSMASFSSHGPTGDGRLGPDVATPGQIVVSVKGGSNDGFHTAQGTSMSSPILTGLGTLVRQYFFDGYAAGDIGAGSSGGGGFAAGSSNLSRRHNPSTALVKATLINGAVRMRGWYTGNDGDVRALDGQWPSWGQGFGRVNLDNSLYFANDPTNNWYMDVYRGDRTGKPACVDAGGVAQTDCTSFEEGTVIDDRNFKIHVEPGKPLDVTLDWTDFASGLGAGSPVLINDLNLMVTGPNGETYIGNNFNSRTDPTVAVAQTPNDPTAAPDDKNVTERIRVASPVAGDYTINVATNPLKGIPLGHQGFALAASGNISKVGSPNFVPGPALQVDQGGNPTMSNVQVTTPSANTAKITFDTNEPTTATADANVPGPHTFIDSYNIKDNSDWPGLNIGPVETSADYADKPMVGTHHEILLTGFTPGQNATVTLKAKDLANNEVSQATNVTTPSSVFQADAPDIGQLYEDDQTAADPRVGKWKTGTQLYAGNDGAGGGVLGAFMFRIPESVNPANITGAAVELTSSHNWTIPYIGDPELFVDLLPATLEPNWGTQDYGTIHDSASDARVPPETTHFRGAYQEYDFTFKCADLQKLKDTLTATDGVRKAAFRYDATQASPQQLFAMEFGFNRRSRGPDLRPKLVLFTNNNTNPEGEACDPNTPAPSISNVGIHGGVPANAVTVSWETDVPSDSFVIYREKTTTPWTQVGTPARTKVHHVEVFGLDTAKHYEFAVRSAACNGASTMDTNGGAGYDFFREPPPPVTYSTNYFFHGNPTDQADKEAYFAVGTPVPAGGLTFSKSAPDGTPGVQHTTGAANEDFVQNTLAAWWYGAYPVGGDPNTINGKVKVNFFASAASAESATVDVTVFADPDVSPSAPTPVQPEKVIGRGFVHLSGLSPTPSLQSGLVPVNGTVTSNMLIQVAAVGLTTEDITFTYDTNAFNANFAVPTSAPPPGAEKLPLAGPVPPPSAGAAGLLPTFRFGPASNADIAGGTGACSVEARANLSLTKTDSPDPATVGQDLVYTLTVHNAGPDPASDVSVVDTLPSSVTFTSSTPPCTGSGTITCPLGTIDSGNDGVVTIHVTPNQTGTITNSATVSSSATDSNASNNTDSEPTTVNQAAPPEAANLSVTKTDSPDPLELGRNLTYTVKVKNNGPQTANGVTMTDTLPANESFKSVTTTKGTCSYNSTTRTVTCNLGNLTNGQRPTIKIVVKPTKAGKYSNTANASATSPADPNTANNQATASTRVVRDN